MRCVAVAVAMALAAVLWGRADSLAQGRTMRVATSVDAATLDPHASNALFSYLIVGQIYEPLTHRGDDLRVHPGLALRWEQVEPTRWRFFLRDGVRFHNGESLDADDVVFSIARARARTSNYGIYVDTLERAEQVDRLTVDLITRTPDAAMPDKLTRVLIMDRGWSDQHRSEVPQNFLQREATHASAHANGTGPYTIRSREADSRTVLVRNPAWWGWAAGQGFGNVTEYHHVVLGADATRVAALLSGEVDMVHVVPAQDIERLRRQPGLRLLEGQENRTAFLGMNHDLEELPGVEPRGRNPFRDIRVRQAIAHAIDMEAIRTRTLRGQAVPTGSMWTQFVNGWSPDNDARLPFDRARARQLLAEAGYPDGFRVPFDCGTGTWEDVCQAIAGMLAQVGIRASLNLQPNAVFIGRVQRRETMFYGLSWGVPTFDALYTMRSVMASRGAAAAAGVSSWNIGGWSDPRFDELTDLVAREPDAERRRALIREAHALHNAELGHIPLYHAMSPWAVRQGVSATHRADNLFHVREFRVD